MQTQEKTSKDFEDFDFPKCPISMMNTRNMSKKEKDKLKKQQEKLDHALAMLQIEQYHFFHLIKEGPEQTQSFLQQVLMKCMTANMSISQSESEENDQPPPPPEQKVQSGQGQIRQQRRGSTKDLNNQRRGSTKDQSLSRRGSKDLNLNRRGSTKAGEPNLNRRGSTKDQNLNRHSGSVGTTNKKRQNSNPTLPCTDRNAIHEAYYFLMKAYVENNPVQKQND